MTETEMRKAVGIPRATLDKMSKGLPDGAVVLEKICRTMMCDADRIVC